MKSGTLDNVDPENNVSKEVKKLFTDKLERLNTVSPPEGCIPTADSRL